MIDFEHNLDVLKRLEGKKIVIGRQKEKEYNIGTLLKADESSVAINVEFTVNKNIINHLYWLATGWEKYEVKVQDLKSRAPQLVIFHNLNDYFIEPFNRQDVYDLMKK